MAQVGSVTATEKLKNVIGILAAGRASALPVSYICVPLQSDRDEMSKGKSAMEEYTLQKVREYEAIKEREISGEDRPLFHLSSRVGWMNDPNGFCWYQGACHLFYQYHPYDTQWGPMHWGHAVSEDLMHWEYLPAAMAPDMPFDRDGCFSGSALELPDGRMLLMYTGVVKRKKPEGGLAEYQAQCLAVGDGLEFEKQEGNPVLTGDDLPEGFSRTDFRDPKIWQCEDGTYRCVAGNRPKDGSGQILLFASEDGFHWTFRKVLVENRGRYGKMWECPDFFSLDGYQVLLVSPQDMLPQGLEYHNGNGTLCLIGTYDSETETFEQQYDQAIDYGIDFYAPQTTVLPDGRRIMIGWMQNWDTCNVRNEGCRWFGQMSLPRELSVKNGRLFQRPVRELEALRCEKVEYRNVLVEGQVELPQIRGRFVDMELEIRRDDTTGDGGYRKFTILFAQKEEFYMSLTYDPVESILKLDRKFSGIRRGGIHQRRVHIPCRNSTLKLRMILDRYSAEIFVNGGEYVMTMTFYTEDEAEGITFLAQGVAKMDIIKYSLQRQSP